MGKAQERGVFCPSGSRNVRKLDLEQILVLLLVLLVTSLGHVEVYNSGDKQSSSFRGRTVVARKRSGL